MNAELWKSILAGWVRMLIVQIIASWGSITFFKQLMSQQSQQLDLVETAVATFVATAIIYGWSALVKWLKAKLHLQELQAMAGIVQAPKVGP